MVLSKYLKIIPFQEKSLILFSTRYGSSVIISQELFDRIRKNILSEDEKRKLQSLGIIVDEVLDEKEEVMSIIDKINERRKIFSVTIVLNLDCNLACKYCYEGIQKGKKYLSKNVADGIIDFLKEEMEKGNNIIVDFYGGEPLLSYETIIYLMSHLNRIAKDFGVDINYNMVTNGTLLNQKRSEELKKYGLNGVKITLDGDEENHNRYRPYVSGSPSFNIILENLKKTSSILKFQIGGNYTKENYRDFPKLLDRLNAEGITPDKITLIKFDPVSEIYKEFTFPEFTGGCTTINEQWIIEASIFLREEILKRGYKTFNLLPNMCVVEVKSDVIINYNGDFYKCPGFLGIEKFKVGNVFTGFIEYSESHKLKFWKNNKCLDCLYLPMCFGGCRNLSFLRCGFIDIDCKKEYYDKTLEHFISQDIRYKVRDLR